MEKKVQKKKPFFFFLNTVAGTCYGDPNITLFASIPSFSDEPSALEAHRWWWW